MLFLDKGIRYFGSQETQQVEHYKFLGVIIASSLKWGSQHSRTVLTKAQQRPFFLRQLKKVTKRVMGTRQEKAGQNGANCIKNHGPGATVP